MSKRTVIDVAALEHAEKIGKSEPHLSQLMAVKARKLRSHPLTLQLEDKSYKMRELRLYNQKEIPQFFLSQIPSLKQLHILKKDEELFETITEPLDIVIGKGRLVHNAQATTIDGIEENFILEKRIIKTYELFELSRFKRIMVILKRFFTIKMSDITKKLIGKEITVFVGDFPAYILPDEFFRMEFADLSKFSIYMKDIAKRQAAAYEKAIPKLKEQYQEVSPEERRFKWILKQIGLRGEDEQISRLSSADAAEVLAIESVIHGAKKKQKEMSDKKKNEEKQ